MRNSYETVPGNIKVPGTNSDFEEMEKKTQGINISPRMLAYLIHKRELEAIRNGKESEELTEEEIRTLIGKMEEENNKESIN